MDIFDRVKDFEAEFFILVHINRLFCCIKEKLEPSLEKSWPVNKEKIMKIIKLINNILDLYDGFHPFSGCEVILEKSDVKCTHEILDIMLYQTGYIVCDEFGIDEIFEDSYPGWLDPKKVILRYFSKFTVKVGKDEPEEVTRTGLIKAIFRK